MLTKENVVEQLKRLKANKSPGILNFYMHEVIEEVGYTLVVSTIEILK